MSIIESSSLWKYPDCRLPENSRVPHQVVSAQSVLRFQELQTSSIRVIISHDQQQLFKRACCGLKTVPIEHNFVRLTKEQVSSGAVVASLPAQPPSVQTPVITSQHTLSAEQRAQSDQSILKFKQPVDAQLLQ